MRRVRPPAGRLRGVLVLPLLTAAIALTMVAGSMASPKSSWQRRIDVDVTASANAGPGAERTTDAAFRVTDVSYRRVKADATANATSTCDGCVADAKSLHVVYLDRVTGGTADNVATAWSRCADCRATSLSVQVVVVRGWSNIRVSNRALAVNGDCAACATASAAFQTVVTSDTRPRFTRAEMRALRRWTAEQAALLRNGAAPGGDGPRRSAMPGEVQVRELSRLVNRSLGTTTLKRRVDVRRP